MFTKPVQPLADIGNICSYPSTITRADGERTPISSIASPSSSTIPGIRSSSVLCPAATYLFTHGVVARFEFEKHVATSSPKPASLPPIDSDTTDSVPLSASSWGGTPLFWLAVRWSTSAPPQVAD